MLLEGSAHLFNKLPNGKDFHAGELKQLRSVDLSAVLLGTPWHYSAQMDSAGKVLFIQTAHL